MKRLILSLLVLCLAAGSAGADVVITMESSRHGGTEATPSVHTISISGKNLKMEDSSDPTTMLFIGDHDELVIVNHEEHSYFDMDKEALAEMGNAMNDMMGDMMKQMEAQLANMPEDQRKMVEKAMKGGMGDMGAMKQDAADAPQHNIKKSGDKKTIEGYPCVLWEHTVDGKMSNQYWVTDWSKAGVKESEFAVIRDMAQTMQEAVKSIPHFGAAMSGDFMDGIDQLDGFPILIVDYEDGKPSSQTTFKSAKSGKIDAGAFAIPDGYKKIDPLAEMKMK